MSISASEMRLENLSGYAKMMINDGSFADFFDTTDNVAIYGFGDLGKVIYKEISDKVNFLGFLDVTGREQNYKDTKIYYPESADFREKITKYEDVKIVVTPVWDMEKIEEKCRYWMCNVSIIPVSYIYAYENLKHIKNYEEIFSKEYIDIVTHISHGKRENISVFLGGTAYSTMIYMCLNSNWKHSICFFADDFMEEIYQRLTEKGIPAILCTEDKGREGNTGELDSICMLADYCRRTGVEIYGADQIKVAEFFDKEHFNIIEDGYGNYSFSSGLRIRNKKNGYMYYGFDSRIRKVYLTGKYPIPDEIAEKVEIVDVETLWNAKSQMEKDEIMYCLGFPKEELKKLLKEGYDSIFLAQKFSRNGLVTEEEQVEMCREVLQKYDKKRVIIKPHPADTVDYQKYFPEYPILYGRFPIDFVKLENIRINKIIGFYSASLYGVFEESQVDMYPEIAEKYGINTLKQEYQK